MRTVYRGQQLYMYYFDAIVVNCGFGRHKKKKKRLIQRWKSTKNMEEGKGKEKIMLKIYMILSSWSQFCCVYIYDALSPSNTMHSSAVHCWFVDTTQRQWQSKEKCEKVHIFIFSYTIGTGTYMEWHCSKLKWMTRWHDRRATPIADDMWNDIQWKCCRKWWRRSRSRATRESRLVAIIWKLENV